MGVPVAPCESIAKPECVASGEDACAEPLVTDARCESGAWQCPAPYVARVPPPSGVCLPFHDGTFRSFEGSLVRVPTDDGRCLWVEEDVTLADGTRAHNFAIDATAATLAGGCPTKPSSLGPIVVTEDPDPSLVIQLDGGVRFRGQTRVVYREFRVDASAVFGLTELGGGIAHWDAAKQKIVVPAALQWGPDLSLGDAVLADSNSLYLWGCPRPPHFLTEQCLLARLDASESLALYGQDGSWQPPSGATPPAMLFDSGPWISSVARTSTGLLHVYAVGFGSDLETHVASEVTGPFTPGASLAHCVLPTADTKSYCAGPVVHAELTATKSRTLAISYGVGTTSPDGLALRATSPDAYWTKLVWVPSP